MAAATNCTGYDKRITQRDHRILFCLTFDKWNEIIDYGMRAEIDLLGTFNADLILPVLKCHGLSGSEEDSIRAQTTKMDRAYFLLKSIRMRPNIALEFIDSLFKAYHDDVAQKLLERFRRIICISDENHFQIAITRLSDKIESLNPWAIRPLLRKGCITDIDVKRIDGAENKASEFLQVMKTKKMAEYKLLLDFLVELNMMTLLAELLYTPNDHTNRKSNDLNHSEDILLDLNSHTDNHVPQMVSAENPAVTLDNESNHTYVVDQPVSKISDCKATKLAVDYFGIPRRKYCDHIIDKTISTVNELLELIKLEIGYDTDGAFLHCMTVLIRDRAGNFRTSWEAFNESDPKIPRNRYYVDEGDSSIPGEILQTGIFPLTEKLPTHFHKVCSWVRPIIRIELGCEAWVMSTRHNSTICELKRFEENGSPFEKMEFVAMMRGATSYLNTEAGSPKCHYLFTSCENETYINLTTGDSVPASTLNHHTFIFKPSLIFIREGERLPRLKRSRNDIPIIYVRNGTSLSFHQSRLTRIYRDIGHENHWNCCLGQTPLCRCILNHFFEKFSK